VLGAIDQTEFMTAVNGNDHSLWKVPCGFFPIGAPMASDAGMAALTSPRDLAKVKQEVKAAGYKGEKIVLLGAVDFPIIKPLGDVTADLLRKLDMTWIIRVLLHPCAPALAGYKPRHGETAAGGPGGAGQALQGAAVHG
jgi:hypothetical protein